MDRQILISIKTVIFTFLLVIGLYIIYRLGPVIAILMIATLIVLVLEPLVNSFRKLTIMNRPMSRSAAVILSYAVFISVLVIVITLGLPPVISETQRLLAQLSGFLGEYQFPEGDLSLQNIIPQFGRLSTGVFSALTVGFSALFTFFSVLILSIYMSLDWENIKKRFVSFFSGPTREEISNILHDVETNIGHWFKGQIFLMVVIGLLSYLGLLLLGINYPLALGLIAGLLEIVPILGPVVTAVIVAIVGFSQDPIKGFAALGLFILIQQLENSLLVPKVMQRVSGFSPLVVLIALLVGSTFFGIVGALIAVPVTMVGVIIIKSILRHTSS